MYRPVHRAERLRKKRIPLLVMGVLALVIPAGLVISGPATADGCSTNHADTWETLSGEDCKKVEGNAETGGVTVPAAPEGRTWSKLIIKKGNGNIGKTRTKCSRTR